ncbi:MAG TPA: serine/threonine-protein kinase [Kofleriaceae bacterium]|nr:serine/threonine-protein kinase [Kofleriaceae bacterium]
MKTKSKKKRAAAAAIPKSAVAKPAAPAKRAVTKPGLVEPGALIGGRYRLVEEAGRGGMAVVWRAQVEGDAGFTRTVAVKQMHENLASQRGYVDMFVEEARIGASLTDSNVAQAHDFVEQDGNYYLVMEWVEGLDLGSYLHFFADRGVRTRWELVTAIGIGVLRGLAVAHERIADDGAPAPIVHRDVSPHNVLLTVQGKVKVIDFGLCLATDRSVELTEPGVVKGKMSYLSPEVVSGERPTPNTDQFACGSLLWEALVGRKLFEGTNDFDTYKKLRDAQVPPLRPLRPDVPRALVAVINRALAAEEHNRYPSVREMARELGAVLKTVKEHRDLHVALGRSVVEARASMGMGRRTGDPSTTTPIAELQELGSRAAADGDKKTAGLWHKLGFWRK